MKKLFSGLFLSIGLIFVFNSCSTDTYYNFDEEDEKWLIYAQGRVMKFQDSTGAVETFYIRSKSRGYKNDGDTYYQHCSIDVVKQDDSVSIGYLGGIYDIRKEAGSNISIAWPHHLPKLNPHSQSPTAITVKGKYYNDVYVSVADTIAISPPSYDIIRFYYSKSAGFVRYDKFNGNSFQLIN